MKSEVYYVDLKVLKSLLDANPSENSELPLLEQLVALRRRDYILVPTGFSKAEFDELFRILLLIPLLQADWTVGDPCVALYPPKPLTSDPQH